MNNAVRELMDLFDLEQLENNLFRGQSQANGQRSVFGGLVAGQALLAASRTVQEDRPAHSLHAYFLRPGDFNAPIVYDVDRIRDGKSFTTRRVNAIQHGRPIFSLASSYQVVEEGASHQAEMPEVPGPDGLESGCRRQLSRTPCDAHPIALCATAAARLGGLARRRHRQGGIEC